MPVTFEPAQPFAPAISSYYGSAMQNDADAPRLLAAQQANREFALRAAALAQQGGGGGGGRGGGGSDIQDAINHRDDAQRQSDQFNAQLNTGVQRDQYEAQSQANLQQSRFELQAQLQDVELSQQEKMRLQRLKNAKGAVLADPTLTDEEKSNLSLQLDTGINPMDERIKTQKLAQEKLLKESMVEDNNAKAALALQQLKGMGKNFEDRGQWNPDPTALAKESATIKELYPNLSDDEVKQQAIAETIRNGAGKQMIMDSKGNFTEADHGRGRTTSVTGAAGGTAGGEGTTKERPAPVFDAVHAYDSAEKSVSADPGIKPEDREAEIEKRYQARKKAFTESAAEFSGAKKEAGAADKPAPFDYRDPKAGTDEQKVKIMRFQTAIGELAKRTDLDPVVQQKVSQALQQAMDLTARFSAPNGQLDKSAPTAVKHKLEELKRFIQSVPDPGQSQPGNAFNGAQESIFERGARMKRESDAEAARMRGEKPAFVPGQQVPGQPPGVVYDEQGRAGVWQPGKRTLRGDVQGLNKNLIEFQEGINRRSKSGAKSITDWADQLGSYLGR